VKQQKGPDEAPLWVPIMGRAGRAPALSTICLFATSAGCEVFTLRSLTLLVLALMAYRLADRLHGRTGLSAPLPTRKMIQNAPDPDPHIYDSPPLVAILC